MKRKAQNLAKKLYRLANNEKGERTCTGISTEACKHVPRNYFVLFLSNMFSKLADTLSNPKTVLTWLMSYVNAPIFLISLIVPIRESGSMLPQIIIGEYVKTRRKRKNIWVMGALFQAISMAFIGVVPLYYKGVTAGWLMVGLLVLFSLSRALCSVASKDVLGKTIPKTQRGKLKGYTGSISGVFVLIAGVYMIYKSESNQPVTFYVSILLFAAALWLLASLFFSWTKEFTTKIKAHTERPHLFASLKKVRKDKVFKHFIISRSLLLCSALSSPFYILLAHKYIGKESYLLGLFVIANGVASVISSPFWGRLADKSSKNAMALGALIASMLGLLFFFVISYLPEWRNWQWLYPVTLFILGIAHSGVRLGRKTYIVDMAEGNQRTDYVTIGNTIIGIILLFTGVLSALASFFSTELVILVLSVLGIIGTISSYRLPNVEKV